MNPVFKKLTGITLCSLLVAAIAAGQLAANPAGSTPPATKKAGAIKALLITGGCCHDYTAQMKSLSEGISKHASVEWTMVREGGTGKDFQNPRYNDADWAKPYDIVIHDACFADTKDADYIRKVLAPHKAGKPAVVLHCAMHTFRDAPTANEYREFLGVTSVAHEPATILDVKPAKDAAKNPILANFPELWKTPVRDEAYILQKEWPNMKPIVTTFGKVNNKDFTAAWTNTYHDARVFGTTLGHSNEVVADPVYTALVARGMLWALDKLGDDGKAKPGFGPAQ